MGYKPPTTGHKLDFTGTAYDGLEVTFDSVPLGKLLDITEQLQSVDQGDVPGMRTLFSNVAGLMESWNVEDKDDNPVPCTVEGLMSQDMPFVIAVIETWVASTSSAPPPLPGTSPSGTASPEVVTAMGDLSQSLPSLPPPKSS